MNPFSRYLRQWLTDRRVDEFVSYWDRLEGLTVRVYREKISPAEAQAEFDIVWPWLRKHYPEWRDQLAPFWQQTRAAGQATSIDPFQLVLDLSGPEDISDDWHVMQHLPAAREALNQYVLHHS